MAIGATAQNKRGVGDMPVRCATPRLRRFHGKIFEDEMTPLDITNHETSLEAAPTHYVEGGGIRFAYRQLGPAVGTPLVLLQHFSGNIDA